MIRKDLVLHAVGKSFMIMVGRMRGTDDAGSVVIERRMMLA